MKKRKNFWKSKKNIFLNEHEARWKILENYTKMAMMECRINNHDQISQASNIDTEKNKSIDYWLVVIIAFLFFLL